MKSVSRTFKVAADALSPTGREQKISNLEKLHAVAHFSTRPAYNLISH